MKKISKEMVQALESAEKIKGYSKYDVTYPTWELITTIILIIILGAIVMKMITYVPSYNF